MGSMSTRGDVFGCLLAVVAFVPVLLAPGYCLGWAINLLGFRKREAIQQAVWGVALSFAVVPLVVVMIEKYSSSVVVRGAVILCCAAMIGLNFWARRQEKGRQFSWSPVLGMVIGLVWVGFVIAALVDIGVRNHLCLSVAVYDHALRSAFVDAVARTGVPPANPLYWPGHAAPMRYYYFWYVLTAAVVRLVGVTARQAFIASVVWAGFGLAAVVALFCRHFLDRSEDGAGLRRRWSRVALALGLLAVTGLDTLPAIAKAIFRLPADADMEWWSGDQVTSWLDSVIWVPHHVAGLICCLFGFLLVWMSKGQSMGQRIGCGLVAGIAFASAFGLSIWVPLAFAMVMVAWIAWVMIWERESRPRVPVLLGAGLVAVVALLPYLNELRAEPAGAATRSTHFLQFGIRRIIDPDALLAFGWFADIAGAHPMVAGSVARLILLLPGYFVELGFFGLLLVAVVMAMRRHRLDESARASVFLTAVALVIGTFLRSTVISSNDFGWRSMLIAQFFLLLLAVHWFEGAFGEPKRWVRAVLYATLWIGVAGTGYQQIMLRLYLPVEDRHGQPDVAGLSQRAMALRRGFDEMDRSIPKDAVIQFNTDQPSDFFRYAQIVQARRQVANALLGCASSFGGDASACAGIEVSVGRLFSPVAGVALSPASAQAECRRLGVGYLVATRWDRVWGNQNSWVWNLQPVVVTTDVRVLDCGSGR